jgi:hypothetical protein
MALRTKNQLKDPKNPLYKDLSVSTRVVIDFLVPETLLKKFEWNAAGYGEKFSRLLEDIFCIDVPRGNFSFEKVSDDPKVHKLSVEWTGDVLKMVKSLAAYGINPESINLYAGNKHYTYTSSLNKPGLFQKLMKYLTKK